MTPFVRRWGDGAHLLIHCGLAHSGALRPLAGQLPGGGVAYDLPGHGKSPAWDPGVDYQALCVDWAFETRPEPGPVFGHSYGGTVALRMAVERPELVTHLTLVEPVFFAAARIFAPEDYAAYVERFAPVLEAREAGDLHLMGERFTDLWGGTPWSELPQPFKDKIASQMPIIVAQDMGINRDNSGVFDEGRLEALECPVTLIRGEHTQPVIASIHCVILERIGHGEDHVIKGAGHMVPLTHPRDVAVLTQPLKG
ncbi:MAG: alpha/beta hydrolase [Pseudomonadota bacterium]